MNTQTIKAKKGSTLYLFHIAMVLVLTFGFGLLDPIGGTITPYGMKAFGVFLGLMYGWIFIDILLPSLFAFAACILIVPDNTLTSVAAKSFGNSTTMMFLMVIPLVYYWTRSGLIDWLGHWFMARKINIGRPWVFSFTIIYLCYILSVLSSNAAAMTLCFGFVSSIAQTSGIPKKGKWLSFMCMGITIAGSFGAVAVPWRGMAIIFMGTMESVTGIGYDMLPFTLTNNFFSTLFLVIYILLGKYFFRIDVSPIYFEDDRYAAYREEKPSFQVKEAGVTLIVLIVWVFAGALLPKGTLLQTVLSGMGLTGVSILILSYVGVRYGMSKNDCYNLYKIFKDGTMWPLLIMTAACYPVMANLEGPDSGIMETAEMLFMPVAESVGPIACIIIIAIILSMITQVWHNIALGLVFIPIFAPIIYDLGVNPAVFSGVLCFACQAAWLTPAASMMSALVFSLEDLVNKSLLVKYALIAILLTWLMMSTIALPIFYCVFPAI